MQTRIKGAQRANREGEGEAMNTPELFAPSDMTSDKLEAKQ
jgi:hypothetical protein